MQLLLSPTPLTAAAGGVGCLEPITHGTRSAEGSEAYAALLSVIETCRRRDCSPRPFLAEVMAEVMALRRKGLPASTIPLPLTQVA